MFLEITLIFYLRYHPSSFKMLILNLGWELWLGSPLYRFSLQTNCIKQDNSREVAEEHFKLNLRSKNTEFTWVTLAVRAVQGRRADCVNQSHCCNHYPAHPVQSASKTRQKRCLTTAKYRYASYFPKNQWIIFFCLQHTGFQEPNGLNR